MSAADSMRAVVVVPDGAPLAEWHAARALGVTASRAREVANGSRSTWRRVRDEQVNGAKFKGNAHTKRGHERESAIIASLPGNVMGVTGVIQSHALLGHPDWPQLMATPDGFAMHRERGLVGVEVKSHSESWGDRDDVPAEHRDQCLWGMFVTGVSAWLYAWEVDGEFAGYSWIERDHARIDRLVSAAGEYLAWRAAGAPDSDELPPEIVEALRLKGTADKAGKAWDGARKTVVDPWLAANYADRTARLEGPWGALTRTVDDVDVLDVDAWRDGDPAGYAEYEDAVTIAADAAEAAKTLMEQATARFSRIERKAGALRITTPKAAS